MKERPVCGDEWTEGGLRSSSQGGKPRPDEIPTADTAPKYHRQKMGPTQGENEEKIKNEFFRPLGFCGVSIQRTIYYFFNASVIELCH